jgi:hypothetical protein
MHTFKSVFFVASFLAAGAAFADSVETHVNGVSQQQANTTNSHQKIEAGVVDMQTPSSSWAYVYATNLRQTQSGGTGNVQEMTIGKIDKNLGNHSAYVTAHNVTQYSTGGSGSTQKVKIGVVE